MQTDTRMLSARLAMTARLVPPGAIVADIGSDHAYLPVYLVRAGIAPRAIAADIGAGPLENARKTIQRAGLQDRIELRLSDGFCRFAPGDAGCWVMAGMGGTLMARLLNAAPWLRRPGTVIVAQPMRHADDLRRWLITHGFRIQREDCCRDGTRRYLALRAEYDGAMLDYPPGYIYYGELPACGNPCKHELLTHERTLLRVRIEALEQLRAAVDGNALKLKQMKEEYDDLCTRCV